MTISRSILIALSVLCSLLAHAHGEQVLLLPVGHVFAFGLLFTAGTLLSFRKVIRLISISAAIVICIPLWLVPGNYFPASIQYSGWGNFLTGTLLPLFTGLLVYAIYWFSRAHGKNGL